MRWLERRVVRLVSPEDLLLANALGWFVVAVGWP